MVFSLGDMDLGKEEANFCGARAEESESQQAAAGGRNIRPSVPEQRQNSRAVRETASNIRAKA